LKLDLPEPGSQAKSEAAASFPEAPVGEVIPENEWRSLERENVLRALRQTGFRVSGAGGAAELLGINAGTLASRMKAFGIRRRDQAK